MRIVLGSGSKSRLKLLHSINIFPDIIYSPNVDETVNKKTKVKDAVYQISKRKIDKTIEKFPEDLIICADTLVYCAGKIFGKPENETALHSYLKTFSGRKNTIYTCVFVYDPKKGVRYRIVSTKIKFKSLSDEEIKNYIASNCNWKETCGGYTIEGLSGKFIKEIQGSYSNVMGLPLYETVSLINNPKLT